VKAVSNTSPLCYLTLIDCVEFLPARFTTVSIPPTVDLELRHPDAPPKLRQFIAPPPSWLVIERHSSSDTSDDLHRLHPGERDAILLAEQNEADIILLDERAARDVAEGRGLRFTGTLGLLADAADRGELDLAETFERLMATNFRASPALLRRILEQHGWCAYCPSTSGVRRRETVALVSARAPIQRQTQAEPAKMGIGAHQ